MKNKDVSKELIIKKLFKLMDTKKEVMRQLDHILDLVISNIEEDLSDCGKKEIAIYRREALNIIEENFESLVPLIMDIYSKHFTESELQELLSFYQSKVGKRFLAVAPLVSHDVVEVSNRWGKALESLFLKKKIKLQHTKHLVFTIGILSMMKRSL